MIQYTIIRIKLTKKLENININFKQYSNLIKRNITKVMNNQLERAEILIGKAALDKIRDTKIAVFGIGGVGSYTLEALARMGVNDLTLIDADKVTASNINRQLIALNSTIGRYKVDVARERVMDINHNACVTAHKIFFSCDTLSQLDFNHYDYIIDAIDTITSKLLLIKTAKQYNIPIISSMGAGNKLDPTAFIVTDIYKTTYCPLAKVMRHELKKMGITDCKVVYSKETPIKPDIIESSNYDDITNLIKKRQTTGSVSYVPSAVGLIIASEVVKDIINKL